MQQSFVYPFFGSTFKGSQGHPHKQAGKSATSLALWYAKPQVQCVVEASALEPPSRQTLPACAIWQSSTSSPGGTSTFVSLTWVILYYIILYYIILLYYIIYYILYILGCGNLLCTPDSQDPGLGRCRSARSLCQAEPEVPPE